MIRIKEIILSCILILINFEILSSDKDRLLFSIEDRIFTTIDLDKRIKYLDLFEDLAKKKTNIDKNLYLNDLISVYIYDQFSKKNNIVIDKTLIEKYFLRITNNFKEKNNFDYTDSDNFKTIEKNFILDNIKYDLQRKKILEELLKLKNTNYDSFNDDDFLNIYDLNFKYFIIENIYKDKFIKINKNLLDYEIEIIKQTLKDNNIQFNFYEKYISDFGKMQYEVKKQIRNNKNKFIIYNNEYFLIGLLNKIIKRNIELKYTIFQIEIIDKTNISYEETNCNNTNLYVQKNRIKVTKYENMEIEKLNNEITKNLINENDRIVINNNDQEYLLILCKINYNKELASDVLKQENIQANADKIEEDFIENQKIKFNFKFY